MTLSRGQWIILIILIASFIGYQGILPFLFATVLAFIPAYYYLRSIRNAEVEDVEPWETLWTSFIWGGVTGIFLAGILNSLFTVSIIGILYGTSSEADIEVLAVFIGAVIVAPFVEEFIKPIVMFRNPQVRGEIDEVEDGIVYGAACGLGFGATENVFYGLTAGATAGGIGGVFLIVVLRTFSSILLHLVASSFTGYGIAKYQVEGESFGVVVKYYFLAVLVHAAWNAAAVSSLVYDSDVGAVLLLAFSILLAVSGLELAKRRIRELDVAGSNIYGNSIRAGDDGQWSTSSIEQKSGWEQKKLRSSSVDSGEFNSSNSGQTADALYQSSTKTPQELADSTTEWAVNYDWRSAIGFVIFLFFILSDIIF